MRPNTVTMIVNALSARVMLDRSPAQDDRRAVRLTVTEAGRQAVSPGRQPTPPSSTWPFRHSPARQRRALAAAVPALDALARAFDRLADTPAMPAEPGS